MVQKKIVNSSSGANALVVKSEEKGETASYRVRESMVIVTPKNYGEQKILPGCTTYQTLMGMGFNLMFCSVKCRFKCHTQ